MDGFHLFVVLLLVFSVYGSTANVVSSPVYETTSNVTRKHYIVYMGEHSFPDSETVIKSNHEMLSSFVGSVEDAQTSIVHHYSKSFRGFSAMLTPKQAKMISKHRSVVSIFEDTIHQLHTTRSWDFMEALNTGNNKGAFSKLREHTRNEDVIVAHLDSGVWPESLSFHVNSSDDLGPVPKRFRGTCVEGDGFKKSACGRKLIGARYYVEGYEQKNGPLKSSGSVFRSPRDDFGHGSHTASIAVGLEVPDVYVSGLDYHTARGGAPRARLAVYKICWHNECSCADILHAYDDAIDDNVDIITISSGTKTPTSYFEDCFAIGALHAFMNGIFVSASAGNVANVVNVAPWMLTVAASSTDRGIFSYLRLGNGGQLRAYGFNLQYKYFEDHPIVAATAAATNGVSSEEASYCNKNTLDRNRIRGKFVVCTMRTWDDDTEEKAREVKRGRGVGMILIAISASITPFFEFAVPTFIVTQGEAERLDKYMSSSSSPVARILIDMQVRHTEPAPRMAMFSAKGPNAITPDIIKPDITAPGVNILAAIPPPKDQDSHTITYGMNSGTSMSCPHASGVAAVIKAFNKEWSPAAIKSAIMTTASIKDNTGGIIKSYEDDGTPLNFGSGHINPDLALNPGLVYDFNINDVIDFLCSQSKDEYQIGQVVNSPVSCSMSPAAPFNLNYPSIGVGYLNGPLSVFRTVTLVGRKPGREIFQVSIESPEGVDVNVVPNVLDFSDGTIQASFRVDFLPCKALGYVHGSITWTNGYHNVRSPILVNTV